MARLFIQCRFTLDELKYLAAGRCGRERERERGVEGARDQCEQSEQAKQEVDL